MAVVQNNVLLVGDGHSATVYAFDSNRAPLSGANVTVNRISKVTGMSYTGNKLAITEGGHREPIKVFTLKRPGTATQDPDFSYEISGDTAGGALSFWCMAWRRNDDHDDLWVIDRGRTARVFRGRDQVGRAKSLPGTEDVYAATFVGDVLIYGANNGTVYAYNVATGKPVPGLELTGERVTNDVPGFGKLACAAYDPVAGILYLGGWGGHVVAFAALRSEMAFPDARYGYRTMSKARLQEEALDAEAGNLEHSFKVVVSARQPGNPQLATLTFKEDGSHQSLYRVEGPFMGITSIKFDARAGAQQYRYQVWMPAGEAQGGAIPAAMKVGSLHYALAVSSLGGDAVAVFVTPAVASAARVSDGTLSRQIDVRYADDTWANGAAGAGKPRTLTNAQLKHALEAPQYVTAFPADPALGQRVNLVRQVAIEQRGILTAALTASADFAGWRWHEGAVLAGALTEAPGNGIAALGSYLPGTGQRANKAVVSPVAGNSTRVPQYVWVNGQRHGVTPIGSDFWSIDGLDGSSFVATRKYTVQVEWTDGNAYPDRTFAPGDYTWNGYRWGLSPETTTRPQNLATDAGSAVAAGKVVAIAADTDEFALVPGADPVAQAGNTARWPLAKLPIVKMTQAQYNAAVAANTIAAGQNVLYVIVG